MNDNELVELARSIAKLPEYQRKQLSILIKSTTLGPHAVEDLKGFIPLRNDLSDLAKLFDIKD